jgi:hypothetical protein
MPDFFKSVMMKVVTRSLPADEKDRINTQLEQWGEEQKKAGLSAALVGKDLPACTILALPDGKQVLLRDLEKEGRPLVLNFGSCS